MAEVFGAMVLAPVWRRRGKRGEARRSAAERYRVALAHTSDAVVIADARGRFVEWNERAERLYGYREDEFADLTVARLVGKEPDAIRAMLDAAGANAGYQGNDVHRRRDGTAIPVDVTIRRLGSGTRGEYILIARGVSAETAGTEHEERYRTLLDSIQLAAFTVDLDASVTYVNPCFERLIGLPKEEILGPHGLDRFVPEEYWPELSRMVGELISGAKPSATVEVPIRQASGGQRLIRWTNTPLYSSDGRIVGLTGIGEDVTELRTAHETLGAIQRHLDALYDGAYSVNDLAEFDELLPAALRRAIELAGFDAGIVRLVSDDGRTLELAAQVGIPQEYAELASRFSLEEYPFVREESRRALHRLTLDSLLPPDISRVLHEGHLTFGVMMPLADRGSLLGTLVLMSRAPREVTDEQAQVLLTIGAQLGVGISRAKLIRADRKRRMYAERLVVLARRLANAGDRQRILDILLAELAPLTDVKMIFCYEADLAGDYLSIAAAAGADGELLRYVNEQKPLPTGLLQAEFRDQEPRTHENPLLDRYGIGRSVLLPLVEGERLFGALELFFGIAYAFGELEMNFFGQLSELVILEIRKANLLGELSVLARSLAASNVQRTVQLEQERDRIRAIVQSVTDPLIVTDLDRKVILANPAAKQIFRMSFEDDRNVPIDEALGRDAANEVLPPEWSELSEFPDVELEITAPDMQQMTLSARTAAVYGRSGDVLGHVTLFRDLTRQRVIDRLKTDFITTAAHELRTPLTTLRGFSELLLTRDMPARDRRRFLEYVHRQSLVLGDIITDLLDISRLEAGSDYAMSVAPCDVRAICLAEAETAQHVTDIHRLDTSGLREVPPVRGNRDRLAQIVRNLLGNAIKYSPDGGDVMLSSTADDRWVRIRVTDRGIGMTAEHVERIFDKFFRVDASTTAVQGTGLGMPIVQRLVRLHGGDVSVESALGQGTTVTVALPRMDSTPLALIVGPDEEWAQTLAAEFARAGWKTSIVHTKEATVAEAVVELPAVVVARLASGQQALLVQHLNATHRAGGVPLLVLADQREDVHLRRISRGRPIEILPPSASMKEIVERAGLIERRRRSTLEPPGQDDRRSAT